MFHHKYLNRDLEIDYEDDDDGGGGGVCYWSLLLQRLQLHLIKLKLM
jgi:hypothetical protein